MSDRDRVGDLVGPEAVARDILKRAWRLMAIRAQIVRNFDVTKGPKDQKVYQTCDIETLSAYHDEHDNTLTLVLLGYEHRDDRSAKMRSALRLKSWVVPGDAVNPSEEALSCIKKLPSSIALYLWGEPGQFVGRFQRNRYKNELWHKSMPPKELPSTDPKLLMHYGRMLGALEELCEAQSLMNDRILLRRDDSGRLKEYCRSLAVALEFIQEQVSGSAIS